MEYKQEGQYPLTVQRAANEEPPGVSTKVNDRQQQGSLVHRLQHVLPMGVDPLRSDVKGTELPPANILLPLERQLIALQLCR